MNKFVVTLFLCFFPVLALADAASLSFAPPASDYSVVFLSNLFGVVDGVLSGTGSQIMGSMFAVFNAAVLALGGIIIMYTLIVSTMNTAHEGQMLGQKWSSIWIPIRSTIGLALLIPKASGYCMMQIFVMWVVVQGVGAADKVWNAALSYLNRGGVIIQAQQINPASDLLDLSGPIPSIANGAIVILSGQVCMMGLQKQLEARRKLLLDQKAKGSGLCVTAAPTDPILNLCNNVVPDFISTVNIVAYQSSTQGDGPWTIPMPYFTEKSKYWFLNGICGEISWAGLGSLIPKPGKDREGKQINNNVMVGNTVLTPAEVATTQMSRAIAVQQMYLDLSSVARTMVGNDRQIMGSSAPSIPSANPNAIQQFGVPYTQRGEVCRTYNSFTPPAGKCVIWGPIPGTGLGGTLLKGTELYSAINTYNGIMMPVLNLARQARNSANANNTKTFINEASARGWIMAGSYFFDLIAIQGLAAGPGASLTDKESGLMDSKFSVNKLLSPFESTTSKCGTGDYSELCHWFDGDRTRVEYVQQLIATSPNAALPTSSSDMKVVDDAIGASTVYGFLTNAMMVQAPGQPGMKPLTFASLPYFSVNTDLYRLTRQRFDCGTVKIFFFSFCLGRLMGTIIWNGVIVTTYNSFLDVFGKILQQVVMAFLQAPLLGMADIFTQGVKVISSPGVNPVVALANMGTHYINFFGNLWVTLMGLSVSSSLLYWFGIFIFVLMSLALPILLTWLGIMVMIGFTTAYYIPILPYMIFTFGALGWLIAVIEAMVAGPIVALGITHPEGHDAFGKGEHAIMILVNVFLRPAMMIIGYIAAIALTYVGVWILNAGYDHAISFMQQAKEVTAGNSDITTDDFWRSGNGANSGKTVGAGSGIASISYTDWAGIYAFFFSIVIYVTMYLVIVQKSFTLISYLPDKILRWIGGNPEGIGSDAAQWGEEVKGQAKDASKSTQDVTGQAVKGLGAKGQEGINSAMSKLTGMLGGGKGKGAAEGVSGESSSSKEGGQSSGGDQGGAGGGAGSSGGPPGGPPVS